VHHLRADAVAAARSVLDATSPDLAARSTVLRDVTVTRSASVATATLAPHVTAAATQAVAPTPVAVLPAAATPVAPPLPANPITGLLTEVFSTVNTLIAPNPAVPPTDPLHLLVFEVVRRIEMTLGLPVAGTPIVSTPDPVIGTNPVSTTLGAPSPADVVSTPYGDIGKWLLQPNGQISTFGGERIGGKTLLEPINVIILDPGSTSTAESTAKLNADLSRAGFPAMPVHSTGFQGIVGDTTFGQQPAGLLEAFSNNLFVLPDDHARAFGPAPVPDGTGYVWTVAISREQFGLNGFLPTHVLVSYNAARDELASRLILSGATLVGIVPLSNAADDPTHTTGDHDGYAIVLRLND
jgi:hypothetical protein